MKVKQYLNTKLLLLGIKDTAHKIAFAILLLVALFLLPIGIHSIYTYRIHSRNLTEMEISYFTSFTAFLIFITAFLLSFITFKSFMESEENSFLQSLPLEKIDRIAIILIKIFPIYYIFGILYGALVMGKIENILYRLIWIPFGILYFSLILISLTVVLIYIMGKVRNAELRWIGATLLIIWAYKGMQSDYSTVLRESSITQLTIDYFIKSGKSPLLWGYYSNVLSPGIHSIAIFSALVLFLAVIFYLLKKLELSADDLWHKTDSKSLLGKMNRFHVNFRFKRPIMAGLYKDFLLFRKNLFFILSQIGCIIAAGFLLLTKQSYPLEALIIVYCILEFFASLLTQDIFRIEVDKIAMFKSLPMKSYHFFLYKWFTNYIFSTAIPLVSLITIWLAGRIDFYQFLITLSIILTVPLVLCFTWSGIVFRYFPNILKSSVPLNIWVYITIAFPPAAVFAGWWNLKKGLKKWKDLEV